MRLEDDPERFWARVEVVGACWLWTGGTDKDGYGRVNGRGAHRIAWEFTHGPIPRGIFVLHSCDVPVCVNAPDHLWLGTQADNIADKVQKGRQATLAKGSHFAFSGEAAPRSKLSTVQVQAIRAEYAAGGVRQVDLAAKYGITHGHVSCIVTGRGWRTTGNRDIGRVALLP